MGKGDRRSRRGKIFRGTTGKRRPKGGKSPKPPETQAPAAEHAS